MSAKHTPEMQPSERRVDAGVDVSLRIGQHVRHQDYGEQRVTGTVRGLSIDSDNVLMAHIVLDAAIIIPARGAEDREIQIWHQHVPAIELTPWSENDALIAEMLVALQAVVRVADRNTVEFDLARAAIAKATGSAPCPAQ